MTRRWNSFSDRITSITATCSITTSSLFVVLLLLLLDWNQNSQTLLVHGQTRNEPVNVNFIIGLPWDVANTLRAPIGGPVSLALSAFVALMLLFGFLLAPVNYILGYPPRIYHSPRVPGILGRSLLDHHHPSFSDTTANYTTGYYYDDNQLHNEGFDMADALVHLFHEVSSARFVFDRDDHYASFGEDFTGRELAVKDDDDGQGSEAPGFLESLFLLVPEEDEICRQLLVCHAHGFLTFLPSTAVKVYQLLSKRFFGIPDNYKDAIVIGLEDQGACGTIYGDCSKDLFHFTRGSIGLIRQNIAKILPEDTKDLWQKFYSKYQHDHQSSRSYTERQ